MGTYKQMINSLGAELLALCKQKRDRGSAVLDAERAIAAGADVHYKGSRPIYFAVKNYNFPIIKLLIDHGALDTALGRRYLAGMSEQGSFDEKREEAFFDLIDYAVKKTGFDIVYLAHFFNMMLVSERLESFFAAAERYNISTARAVSCVRQMIIFEVIALGREKSLHLINTHLPGWERMTTETYLTINGASGEAVAGLTVDSSGSNDGSNGGSNGGFNAGSNGGYNIGSNGGLNSRLTAGSTTESEAGGAGEQRVVLTGTSVAIDAAVTSGHSAAAEYILKKHADIRPSKESIARAIAAGHIGTLKTLHASGISLADEGFIKTACRIAKFNTAPLSYFAEMGLLKNGVGGKSVYQLAKEWGDPALLDFVRSIPAGWL